MHKGRMAKFVFLAFFLKASVNSVSTNRSRLLCYTFVLLGLGLLIFTWGLQYKLSLYAAPHSAVRHMVKAKLLANDKQIGARDGIITVDHADDVQAWSAFSLTAVFVPLLALSILRTISARRAYEVSASEPTWRVPTAASFNAFSFRPPPAAS